MAFSFNWAGLNVPTIAGKRDVQIQNQQADIGGKLGKALRGYEDRKLRDELNDEYSKMLDEYGYDDPNLSDIQEQIDALKAENAQLLAKRNELAGG